MRKLYFQEWTEKTYKGPWFTFDTDPNLKNSRKNMQNYCIGCMSKLLYDMTTACQGELIDLGHAWNCWKPILVLKGVETPEESRDILKANQDSFFPDREEVYGKIGGNENPGEQALIMYARTMDEAQVVRDELESWAGKIHPNSRALIARGCNPIHGLLFGDWRKWKRRMPIDPTEENFQTVRQTLKSYFKI